MLVMFVFSLAMQSSTTFYACNTESVVKLFSFRIASNINCVVEDEASLFKGLFIFCRLQLA